MAYYSNGGNGYNLSSVRKKKKEEEKAKSPSPSSSQPSQPKTAQPAQPKQAEPAQPKKKFEMTEAMKRDQMRGMQRTVNEYSKGVKTTVVKAGEVAPSEKRTQEQTDRLNERNRQGKLKGDWGVTNEISVDVSTIKDIEQLAFFNRTLESDSARKAVAKAWAKRNGMEESAVYAYLERRYMPGVNAGAFDKAQTDAGKLSSLGLYTLNGDKIDLDTASPDTVYQAICDIADDDKRKAAEKLFLKLAKDKNHRFYGYDAYAKDYSFRDSAVLTKDGYKNYVSGLSGKFDPREDKLEASLRRYMLEYEQLEKQGGYILSQKGDALKAAFMQQMGVSDVPDIDELRRMFAEQDSAGQQNQSGAEDEPSTWDKIKSGVKEWWDGFASGIPADSEQAEDEEAEIPEGEEAPTGYAYGGGSSGGGSSSGAAPEAPATQEYPSRLVASGGSDAARIFAETANRPLTARVWMPGEQDEEGEKAEVAGPVWKPKQASAQPAVQPGTVNMESDVTGALVNYVLKGNGGMLDDATEAAVEAKVRQSPEHKALFGILSGGDSATLEARSGGRSYLGATVDATGKLGGFAPYAQRMQELGALPDDIYDAAVGTLIQAVDAMASMPLTDEQQRLVDAGLTTRGQIYTESHPAALSAVKAAFEYSDKQSILAQKEANASAERNLQEAVAKARQRLRTGYYTEADLNLAQANTPVRSRADKNMDKSYQQMAGALQAAFDAADTQAWDMNQAALWAEFEGTDVGAVSYDWLNQQTMKYLTESGLPMDLTSKEAAHHRAELLSYQMEALSAEDDMAYLMGYENVGAYWQATGTGTMEALQAKALALRAADIAAENEPEPEPESPYKGDGSTSTWTVILASSAAGVVSELEETWTALSNLGIVKDQEAEKYEVRDYYYSTGSFVDANARADADLRSAIAEGYIPDETVAKKVLAYLDNGGRALDLGIKLSNLGWSAADKANDAAQRYEDFTKWSYEHYDPKQGRIGRFAESAASNTLNAAENFILSAPLAALPGASTFGRFLLGTGASVAAYAPRTYNEGVQTALEGGADFKGADLMGSTMSLAQAWSEMYTDLGIFDHIYDAMGIKATLGTALEQIGPTGARRWAKAIMKGAGVTVGGALEEATKDELWGGFGEGAAQALTWKTIQLTGGLAEMPNPSELLKIAGAAMVGGFAALPETLKETYENFGENFIGALPLTILSGGAAGYKDWKSTRDVKKAVETGKPEDIAQAGQSIVDDMRDPQKAAAIDEAAAQARVGQLTQDIILHDTGEVGTLVANARKLKEQADSHQKAYTKAFTANRAAKVAMIEAQAEIDAGGTGEDVLRKLADAQEAFAESSNVMDESWREYQQKKAESDVMHAEAYTKARNQAAKQVQKERAAMTQEAQAKQEARAQAQNEADLRAMEVEAFIEEQHKNDPEEKKEQIRQELLNGDMDVVEPSDPKVWGGDAADLTPEKRQELLNAYRFMSSLKKMYGVKVRFATAKDVHFDAAEMDAMYDHETGEVIVSPDATPDQILHAAVMHELTHRTEKTGQYGKLAEALIHLKYGDDQAAYEEALGKVKERYSKYYESKNWQLEEGEAERELVAKIAGEILGGNKDFINRFVYEKPTVARWFADKLKSFVDKMKGVKGGKELAQLRKVEKMFRKALKEAQTQQRSFESDGISYSLREKEPPKNVVYAYKAFYARDGKLYPPMVSNITEESDKQKVKGATSGTMKSLPTPVGVWLDADIGGIMVDKKTGEPVRTPDTGRLRVKNDKSSGSSLAFRPGWHLGEWPDAKQFNKGDLVPYINHEGEQKSRRMLMPDDLVFAKCEVSADVDYQLDALSYGISDKGSFSRSQAGLPYVPDDGYYKYRTNVDPTTAPWLIAGSIKVTEILDDDDCARICAEFGVTPDKRESGKKINLADYGLKRGPVEASVEGMEQFRENDANRANKALLERSLNDPNYADAYVQREIDFDNPKQYAELQKEFAMNGQDIETYRQMYETQGFASEHRAKPTATSPETGEPLTGELRGGSQVSFSLRSWTESEEIQTRAALVGRGFSGDDVDRWIGDVNSIARIVAENASRLDFIADDDQVMLKPNQEYVKTLDASTLCAKRLLYQGTFNAIQHAMPDHVFSSEELLDLLNVMKDMGYESPCGVCYVESRRRHLGKFAKEWLEGRPAEKGKKAKPPYSGSYIPHMDELTTTDGLAKLKEEHPDTYKDFVKAMNALGSANPKLVEMRTDYRGDIRKLTPKQIEKILRIGGLRVQSFSDFETPHLLDMAQAVLDMAAAQLTSQAYTKVPNFAWVFGDTGIKINLSLLAEGSGLDENGNLIFSSSEGMDFEEAMKLRDRYSKNVGTILVGANDDHIRAAMADPRIDYIIPFHKSGWGQKELDKVGVLNSYTDYTDYQNERLITGGKPEGGNFYPIDYWDETKTGDENAEIYLRKCEESGRIPKFEQFLTKGTDGHWVAPSGYWKMLIDFKMYDNDGDFAPQEPVRPNLNMDEAVRVLGEYEGGANELPVAQDIVDEFVETIKKNRSPGPEGKDGRADHPSAALRDGGRSDQAAGRGRNLTPSLTDTPSTRTEFAAWRANRGSELPPGNQMTEYSPKPHGDGERQFATRTAQRSEAMPEWLKAELYANPEQRYYLKDTNNDQLMRAWGGIMERGYEQERDRILQVEHMSADDVATANVVMAMAFRNNDMNTAMLVAHKYNTDGTLTAKALQARKLFSRMTPAGLRAKVAGEYETKTAEYMRTHEPAMRDIRKRAKKKEDAIKDLQGGDELLRLTSGDGYTIKPNKWNMPLNEQQLELIRLYHLENVPRPGDLYYNRATKEQRMLEAILQTPNPLELTGNGLNLVQRLEMLNDNLAVVTNADLHYIGDQLARYAFSDADTQQGREGDLALSRAYEAYGNINPATMSEKIRTWGYISMLTSLPSAGRNIVGNVTQNTQIAVADGLATTIIDPLVGLFTKNRTRAHLTAKQRAEGWIAAANEAKYTWRDYLGKDKTVVQRGGERFNLNQRGRVYQNQTLENLRLLEGYLMSIGDRPVWMKRYVNILAEQMNLAEKNGVEFDYDAAVEIAEAEANYATFNEDNKVADWLAQGKQIPGFGWILHFAMPFTGVPTNILRRPVQFSPVGLAATAVQYGIINPVRGKNFDQRAFVDGMARGLTGTMTWALGACLLKAGLLHFGTSEDEDDLYYLNTAQGEQYTAYLKIGDMNIGLSTFSPAASAILGGAYFAKELGDDENLFNAFMNASMESFDTILDASYLTGLTDLLTATTEDGIRGAATSLAQSAVSMNIPVALGQLADHFDPYVRDTKDASVLKAAINAAINKVPILREEMLPAKVDITGEKVKSKPAFSAFWQPLSITDVRNNKTLDGLERLYRKYGKDIKIPGYLIPNTGKISISKTVADEMYGMDYSAGEHKLALTGAQRVKYNTMYGKLMMAAYDEIFMDPSYDPENDEFNKSLVDALAKSGRLSEIKREVERQICIDLGYDF